VRLFPLACEFLIFYLSIYLLVIITVYHDRSCDISMYRQEHHVKL